MPMSLFDLRKSYELATLTESDVAADPLVQFDRWFQQALEAELEEPNAMTLATVGANGRPSSRIVLLKGFDLNEAATGASGRGLIWFTNYASRKAAELALHPYAALQFHWIGLERQVRIEGTVERTSAAESDEYFASRPLDSRIGAWASPQSEKVASREFLDAEHLRYAQRFGAEVPRPAHWGGYRLVPTYFEFWQGRPSRLHDRICYGLDGQGVWDIARLAP
jgi:pyridoxamine 5'-phosphate oxidase